MRIKFDEVCEEGAARFRGLWLRANEVAVDAIRMCGGNPADTKTKTMVALVVLRVLVLAKDDRRTSAEIASLIQKALEAEAEEAASGKQGQD